MAAALMAAKRLAPGDELLEKWLAAAGGFPRFQRLETVSYDFVRKAPDGTVTRGRHLLKLHDGQPLRIREEARTPAGERVTVVTSSGVWRTVAGAPVGDAETLRRAGEELLPEALWVLAPGLLREGACPVSYVGKGYLNGKLGQRISVEKGAWPADRWLAAPGRPVTIYLDETTRLMDGAEFTPPGRTDPVRLAFSLYADRRGHLVPLQRETLDADGNRIGSFSLTQLAVNELVEEALFSPQNAPVPPLQTPPKKP